MIRWIFLLCIAFICGLGLLRLILPKSRKEAWNNIKSIIPEVILLVVTFAIFCPSSLFLANQGEFAISYGKVLPIILGMAAAMAFLCFMGAAIVWNERLVVQYRAFILAGTLGIYVQSNFLNPDLPELNGAQVDWSQFVLSSVISVAVWLVLLIGLQGFAAWKRDIIVKISKYTAYFLSAVQLVSLVVLILTTPKSSASNVVLTKEDQFTVGNNDNVIVFVLDSMGGEYLEENINKHADLKESLTDFTFFRNAVSGGAYTAVGMPVLLTGIEFDPSYQNYENYLQEAWADTRIYEELNALGYDIRILTDGRYMANVSDTIINNAYAIGDTFYIEDYLEFAKDFYKFVGIYTMPQILKPYFWMYTEEVTSAITATGEEDRKVSDSEDIAGGKIYKFDDVQFYQDLMENGLEAKYDSVYRIYHLFGPHAPFTMNENIENVGEGNTTEEAQLLGSMKIVNAYIEELQELGLYEDSTIIITADHGRAGADGIQQNPALLIKQPGEKHDLEYNNAPVHFRNVVATVAKAVMEDYHSYGPSIYDITVDSDVERTHTVAQPVKVERYGASDEDKPFMRFVMPDNAADENGIIPYEPEKINRIRYTIGDKIDFAEESPYTEALNYRIYKEDNIGITSNEFSIAMELENYNGGNLEFSFCYSKVYNESQRMKIYAAGELLSDMTCYGEKIGEDITIEIPKDRVQNGILPIRMVFYNAVTPKQIGTGEDSRILSVGFDYMRLAEK